MSSRLSTVFFLSDYGVQDEFAGVVRAVIRRLAPGTVVVDLTHEVAPFDVMSGARVLERAAPHLGDGVVLGIVDPGVGSARRPLALRCQGEVGPQFFVGPDNGLLLPAVQASGALVEAVALCPEAVREPSATFDGRDVFAPAVAALCNGAELEELGPIIELASLVHLEVPVPREERLEDGRLVRWCEVTWVDRFGNLQLNVAPTVEGRQDVVVRLMLHDQRPPHWVERTIRRVHAFADLEPEELGLLVDANDHLAVVLCRASASDALGVRAGEIVGLCDPSP